jgi:hypothetical protein
MEEEIRYLEDLISYKTNEMYTIDRKSSYEAQEAFWKAEKEVKILQNILNHINDYVS